MHRKLTKLDKVPNIITLRQACDILNCHPNTLRNWDNKGLLKAIRFGKRGDRRYQKPDILRLLKNNDHG
jgi:DNA-binding transcriptional MerR regulator